MSKTDNPFAPSYQNWRVVRTLLITYEDDSPPVWRPLHASQSHLPNDKVERLPCLIGDEFALVTEGQDVSDDLKDQCNLDGVVRIVVYAIVADDFDGRPKLVGDTYSEDAALETVRRLKFTGRLHSRCCEISSNHLTGEANRFLTELADLATPRSLFSIAFRIPHGTAIGVKLIATPWTDSNLQSVQGITVEQLRQEQRTQGMPEPLADVLHMAALADVRILIFDIDAPMLTGLPLYDLD